MQFTFMAGHGATGTISILRQMQENFLGKGKGLCFALESLELGNR